MKNKLILLTIFSLTMILSAMFTVRAYSPHYLPGGKNYLCEDNFFFDGSDYATIDPFVIKPYTDYTLTVPRLYTDNQVNDIMVYYYDNGAFLESMVIPIAEMSFYDDGGAQWFYYSFRTLSSSNYMALTFDNTFDYFTYEGVNNVQLEEGTSFSGYETYIEGQVMDTAAPFFQNAGDVISYYDSPITVSEIQSALTAYDSVDGDVTASITLVSDNYTPNMHLLGSYELVFEVSDLSLNTSQVTINVNLVDVLSPVFSDLGTIQAVYPNTYTTADILAMLSASDNYDGDISSSIVLMSDNYTANASIVGDYQMLFSVTDSSGNQTDYTQAISVIDNQGPVISGTTSIVVGYDTLITDSDIRNNLSYIDNYDDAASLTLILESDNYSANHTSLGNYIMVYSVTDSSGNKTTQNIQISVVDEIGPMVYFDSSIIQTYTDTVMALPDFTQLLINANEIESDQDYLVTIRYDSYSRNAHVPGIYHLSLDFKTENGEHLTKDLQIKVIDRPVDYIHLDDALETPSVPFFEAHKTTIIGGSLSLVLIVTNVLWFFLTKKKMTA